MCALPLKNHFDYLLRYDHNKFRTSHRQDLIPCNAWGRRHVKPPSGQRSNLRIKFPLCNFINRYCKIALLREVALPI